MTDRLTTDALMRAAPVIPVLVVDDPAVAPDLAHALAEGGLTALEVTLRTPNALAVVRAMADAGSGVTVGAGTVLDAEQLNRAVDAGARFIVSPGLTEGLARAAEAADVPLLPGVATAGEIMRGLDLGLDRFKFFPAESSGGAAAVAAFTGPFGGVAFCPTGGINARNAPSYLSLKTVLCVGGAWVAPREIVEARDWPRIATLARQAAGLGRAGV